MFLREYRDYIGRLRRHTKDTPPMRWALINYIAELGESGLTPSTIRDNDPENTLPLSIRSCGKSNFLPDLMICPHPRFPTLVRNVCHRRGVKTTQLIPVFKDDHTAASSAWDKALPLLDNGRQVPDRHVVTQQ